MSGENYDDGFWRGVESRDSEVEALQVKLAAAKAEVERLRGEKDAVVAAEREAICQIVRWHCVSDKDARRLIEAIRARGEK